MAKQAKKSEAKSTGPRRNRSGLLPGQYRKRSTVYVERLRDPDETRRLDEDALLYTTDAYIVISTRTDGQFAHTVELRGDQTRLPGKVVERIIAHRAAIVTEERSDRARERQERIKAEGIAQVDQEEAEAEAEAARERDLNQYQGGICISGVLKTTERTPQHLILLLGPNWVPTDNAV